jgi:hypothetical protein
MAMQALVMGFGGTGAHILTSLKELTVLKHGTKPDSVKFLFFDTIADWRPGKTVKLLGGAAEEKVAQASEEKNSLDPLSEYFYLGDHDPDLKTHVDEFLDPTGSPERHPHLKDWLHAPWLKLNVKPAYLNILEGAAQQRQIGRFAIFQNAERVKNKIAQLINELAQQARNASINVWILGSSAGGTGAGCMLDAAYLTRLAADHINRDIQLTGVIVLPDVYEDKSGISRARAYSLCRELSRIQGIGIGQTGEEASMEYTSRVFYDQRFLVHSTIKKPLFDRLFFLGRQCRSDEERSDFFASVANAIDPYLDEHSGPVLLQEVVNETSPANSMGAARFYVPEKTLADIFACEQVETYLRRLAPPNEEFDGILDIYSGSATEREEDGNTRVRTLLAIFDALYDRATNQRDDLNRDYIQRRVTPEMIVTEWYQFGGGAIAGFQLSPAEKVAVQLTYINPYISFVESDDSKVQPIDRVTKTYKENEKAKGLRETQEQSKDRFSAELDDISKRYTNVAGGERTFAKGLKQVSDIISAQLRAKVDQSIVDAITQATSFVVDPNNQRQGTVLTRLRAEGQYAIRTLQKIDELIGKFIATLNEESARREQQPVSALNQLNSSSSPGFYALFSTWVESYQISARDECYEYIGWYQKRELLKNMQQLVRGVIQRFEQWQRVFDGILNTLVLDQPESALYIVRNEFLNRELNNRLARLGQNRSARISWKPEPFDKTRPDVLMQGYREELKKCVYVSPGVTLADEALNATRWEAYVNKDGQPELKLAITNPRNTFAYSSRNLANIHRDLRDYFLQQMDGALKEKDIFDYLLYAQRQGASPQHIADLLTKASEVLINAKGEEECRLVYKDPIVPEKQNLAAAIKAALAGPFKVNDSETTHSDKNSITLLSVKKPNIDDIEDLRTCRTRYIAMQTEHLKGDKDHDNEVNRSKVYHAFRAELEAWFIERHYCLAKNVSSDEYQIPPRIVRLLDDPAMMHVFVQCLATGAIEKSNDGWLWHDTTSGEDVTLVSMEDHPGADLVQAANTFVLLQRDGRKGAKRRITYADARQSSFDMPKRNGKTKDEMLVEFSKGIKTFVAANLRAARKDSIRSEVEVSRNKQETLGVEMVLDFYSNPETRTALQYRME